MRWNFLLPAGVFVVAVVGSVPAWSEDLEAGVLPANLPLRREPISTIPAPSWLAASGTLALLAFGGTILVGRHRKWAWLAAARSRTAPGRELVRVSSQALTAQASVHAVRWNGEELLLACTAQHVTLLARRPAPTAEDSA
jgi:uncharacterized protein YbjT (DUF2867 family)